MALMILAHPNMDSSVANKTISETIRKKIPNIEIRNIHQLYPNYQIDVAEEQAALLKHDLIILQYPMYWFNMPAILKIWFDEVLTYQFAYGSKGDKLKNKNLQVSLTVGGLEKQNGRNIIEDFLLPVKQTAEYIHMNYLSPIILYGLSPTLDKSHDQIIEKSLNHSTKLQEIIIQYK